MRYFRTLVTFCAVLLTVTLMAMPKAGVIEDQTISISGDPVYICQGENGGYIPSGTTKIFESHALHINWGWYGICNGYFTFGSYNTASAEEYDTGLNYVSYDFCRYIRMIPNIRKPGLTPLPL